MSSKRRRHGDENGANRNLDGRRLRTVTEAKALAEYLAIKPDMDKKEKESRRARWEEIIEIAERREVEIKSGSNAKVDGQWVEDKEEAGERIREAVKATMRAGLFTDNLSCVPEISVDDSSTGSDDEDVDMTDSSVATMPLQEKNQFQQMSFFGFDDDDAEYISENEELDDQVTFNNEDITEAVHTTREEVENTNPASTSSSRTTIDKNATKWKGNAADHVNSGIRRRSTGVQE